MIRPTACRLVRRSIRAVSTMVSLIPAMPVGQGCPPRAGTGASPSGMRTSASLMSSGPWWRAPAGGVREADVAAQVVADRCLAQLGEGGQGRVSTGRVPGPGLGPVPGQQVLPGLECLLTRRTPW